MKAGGTLDHIRRLENYDIQSLALHARVPILASLGNNHHLKAGDAVPKHAHTRAAQGHKRCLKTADTLDHIRRLENYDIQSPALHARVPILVSLGNNHHLEAGVVVLKHAHGRTARGDMRCLKTAQTLAHVRRLEDYDIEGLALHVRARVLASLGNNHHLEAGDVVLKHAHARAAQRHRRCLITAETLANICRLTQRVQTLALLHARVEILIF